MFDLAYCRLSHTYCEIQACVHLAVSSSTLSPKSSTTSTGRQYDYRRVHTDVRIACAGSSIGLRTHARTHSILRSSSGYRQSPMKLGTAVVSVEDDACGSVAVRYKGVPRRELLTSPSTAARPRRCPAVGVSSSTTSYSYIRM